MTVRTDIEVVERPGRFEARVGGEPAGFLDYRLAGDVATMPHTVVEPRFEGSGVGSALVQAAVQAARDRGWRIVPSCWFVAGWLQRHPEHQDLLR